MSELIVNNFFILDFIIGFGTPAVIIILHIARKVSTFTWRMFWVGTAIGLTWEIPLSTLDGLGIVDIFSFLTHPPAHFSFIIASHSFWDGGLFLAGILIVRMVLKGEEHFTRFRSRELGILLLWGQVQELCVELLSTGNGGWSYNPAWWNPQLFHFNGRPITLLPQLIWLAAPVLFYVAALRIQKISRHP
ncbi:MAG: hypothetical protein JW807_12575 [Spirochaetes bacterium]|nr:hypothetical protein [Spirochaetota bacterium]